jgi:hypothetical protein
MIYEINYKGKFIEIYENDYKIGVLRNSFPHDMNFKTLSFRYDFLIEFRKVNIIKTSI